MEMDLSFEQINDLLDMFPDILTDDNPMLQENNLMDYDPLHLLIPPQNIPTILPDQPPINNSQSPKPEDDNRRQEDSKKKKISHQETERQRRKEMAGLYRDLRSMLPIERIKGKRSSSDHIHETVGYIKQLQNRIENLSQTRDRLKQQRNSSRTLSPTQSCSLTSVSVRGSMAGMEVVINTASLEGVNLSRVLNLLNRQGLNIIGCVSAKADERLLHTIETEVIPETSRGGKSVINPSELQQTLTNFCNHYHKNG